MGKTTLGKWVSKALFVFLVILGVISVVPITGIGFQLPKLLVFSVTAFVCTTMLIWKKESVGFELLLNSWFGRLLLVFVLTVFFSLLWSVAPVLSIIGSAPRFMGVLTYSVFFTLGLYALSLSQNEEGRKVVLLTIVLSNALVVIYGLLQIVGLDPLVSAWRLEFFLGRTFSVLGQPNALGSFILLTLPFVWIAGKKARFKILSVCNVVVLLSTSSRAALLGLIVMVIAFMFVRLDEIKKRMNKKNVGIVAIVFIILVGIGWQSFSHRFSGAIEGGRSSSARMIILGDTLEMIKARPFGYGLDTMGIVYPRFMSAEIHEYEPLTAGVDRAHSMPLDLLITLGPLGLISYYGFLMLLISQLWKKRRDENSNVITAGGLALVGYSVSLLFGFEMVATAVFFWIVCGLVVGELARCKICQPVDRTQDARYKFEKLIVLMLTLPVVVSCVVSVQLIQSRLTMNEAEQEFTRGNVTESLTLYEDAVRKFRFDRMILGQVTERTLFVMEGVSADETRDALGKFVNSLVYLFDRLTDGQDGTASLLGAWIAVLEGDPDRSRTNIARARELMPTNVSTERVAMHIYELLGDEAGKRDAEKRLIELLPSYWQDVSSDKGRILWKENSWLKELNL
jgi:hypothetical protein